MNNSKEMKLKAIVVVGVLQGNGYEAVFAGGYIRDIFMGLTPNDIDIATNATPEQVEEIFQGHRTIPVGREFGVVRLIFHDIEFEIATFRCDGEYKDGRRPDSVKFSTMKEDAERRDFTIGGMFYNPISKEIIDYVGGKTDIKKGVIRFIGDPAKRIAEDKLRILRAVRFSVRFGFQIDPESLEAIKENAEHITSVSFERIQEELVKMLKLKKPRKVIGLLKETGLLKKILPEVENLDGAPQSSKWHPEGDVLEHTIRVMENLVNESVELQLVGMFHDIAKPQTTIVEDGKIKTPGHEKPGAEIARTVLRRLKFSNRIVESVGEMVYAHMKVFVVPKMKKSNQKKFLARDDFEKLRIFHRADKLGGSGNLDTVEALEEVVKKFENEELKPISFVDGRDLMNIGFVEGCEIGKAKRKLYDLQLEGTIVNKTEALEFAKSLL